MNFKKIIIIYVFIFTFSVLPMVYAQEVNNFISEHSDSFSKRHERMKNKIQKIYSQLDLTSEQKKQLEDNKQKNQEKRKALFEKMRSYKGSLNQELMKPTLDMNKINDIQSQSKVLQSEIIDDRLNSILEVRKILTPQQFTKFISLMEKYKHEESLREER